MPKKHAAGPIDLSGLELSAKIDFVTVATTSKCELPALSGSIKWPRLFNNRRLTIHDPTPDDLRILVAHLRDPDILELEVAVDLRPSVRDSESDHTDKLHHIYYEVNARLLPWHGARISNTVMGVFNPFKGASGGLEPFDMRRPRKPWQAIYGHRDHPAQVKLYIKTLDQRESLPWQEHVVRTEVRLSGVALADHDLTRLSDLFGFRYRNRLSPYFRLVHDSRRRFRHAASEGGILKVVRRRLEEIDQDTWADVGAPGFRDNAKVVMRRDIEANRRFGQALRRIEKLLAKTRFEPRITIHGLELPCKSMTYTMAARSV